MRPRPTTLSRSQIQARLLTLAAVFLFLYSLILTLAPAARARSWDVQYHWSQWLGFGVWVVVFLLAHILTKRRIPEADPYLLPLAALLTGWGILTIYRLVPSFRPPPDHLAGWSAGWSSCSACASLPNYASCAATNISG